MNESWIPQGFHTITPNIIVNDAESPISFLKRAFGATERYRLTTSNEQGRPLRARNEVRAGVGRWPGGEREHSPTLEWHRRFP